MAAERREFLLKLQKGVGSLKNRELAKGMTTWRSVWADLKRTNDALRRGMSRFTNPGLARGWAAWAEMARERAEFLLLLRKGLSFMVHRQVAMATAAWREACRPFPWLAMVARMHKLLDVLAMNKETTRCGLAREMT